MQKKTKVGIAIASSVLVVALGVTGGLLIAGALEPSRQYDFGSEGAMDRGKLLEAYEHLGDSKNVDYTEEFTPAEAANVAYGLFERNDRFATRGEGLATALFGVKQEIFSTQIREGESYFEESNSKSSFVNVAWRMYEEGDETVQYKGVVGEDVEEATFEEEGVTYDNEEYSERMGRNVHSVETYVINSETVLMGEKEGEMHGVTSFEKTAEGYRLELELDPATSVVNYVRQMKTISNLAEYPYFHWVHLTFELREDLTLVSLVAEESYKAKLSSIISSDVTSSLTTTFHVGQEYDIPLLNAPTLLSI